MPSVYAAIFANAIALVLAACASDTTNYPSLARRPVETANTSETPVPTTAVAPAPASPQDIARLGSLVEQAREAHRRYMAKEQRARQTVAAASGAAQGSENWSVASVALAELESERSAAMVALADIDQLFADARIAGNDTSAISAARDEVSGWIGDEDKILADLRGGLGV